MIPRIFVVLLITVVHLNTVNGRFIAIRPLNLSMWDRLYAMDGCRVICLPGCTKVCPRGIGDKCNERCRQKCKKVGVCSPNKKK